MSNLTVRQSFAPTTLSEAMQFSEMLSRSTMVPKQYQGKPDDIMVAVQWGAEIGLAPLQALQNLAVINGKPSVYGDAAMALVQNSPVCEDIEEYLDGETAVCVARRTGRKPVTAKFSVDDAKRAGLWGKQGPWTQYPKRMLQMRARGFALRDAFPDVLKGLITIEEAQDYPTESQEFSVDRQEPPVLIPYEEEKVETTSEEGPFKILLPGGDVYAGYNNQEQWINAYVMMMAKIRNSAKLNDDQKAEKLDAFRSANETGRKGLDTEHSVMLARMSKAAQEEAHSPKREAHLPESEPSESGF